MKGLTSLNSARFRRTFLTVYALSAIVPLLALIYFFHQHVYSSISPKEMEQLRLPVTIVLAGMFLVPGLGFVLLSRWIKGLEKLTDDVRRRTAELSARLEGGGEAREGSENEMAVLRHHFEALYGELQDKMNQLSQYSHLLIDTNIKLSEKAVKDELTGLFNRRYFDERLIVEVHRADELGYELAMIMMDVDGFKRFNDELGHPAGDEVLRRVGRVIRAVVRKADLPFRYGGDEFAVLLPQCGLKDASAIAGKIIRALREDNQTEAGAGNGIAATSASCGVAVYTGDAKKLVRDADLCLLGAKKAGKGRVVFKKPVRVSRGPAGKEEQI